MTDIEKDDFDRPSKSQIKKAMADLQKIGQRLTELSLAQLETIPLPAPLREAIEHAHRLKKNNEAMRRHLQYIGKLMREIELGPILAALQKLQDHHLQRVKTFHRVEEWRDRLIATGDEGLQALLALHPEVDRQLLRQLIRNAQRDQLQQKNSGAQLALFRYLQTFIQS